MAPAITPGSEALVVRSPHASDAIGASLRNAYRHDDRAAREFERLLSQLDTVRWIRQ